jgi:very-short-patch-repair endonuclease
MPVKKALQLRRNMTDAERKLWAALRDRQLDDIKFRRQHPLGPYVLDFFSEAHKLVIEIDGGQHAADAVRDAERTAWLKARGCRILRFWNNEVLSNLPGVLTEISRAAGATPHPLAAAVRPLPTGEVT